MVHCMCRRLHDRLAAVSRREEAVAQAWRKFDDAQRLQNAELKKKKRDLEAHHQARLAEMSTKVAELVSHALVWL